MAYSSNFKKLNEFDLAVFSKIANTASNFFQRKKILITGSTGLVGISVLRAFIQLREVYQIEIELHCSSRDPKSAEAYHKKLLGTDNIRYVQSGQESSVGPFDFVFHAASGTNPKELLEKPLSVIDANVHYTRSLLDALVPKTGTMIFFSTREIYGARVAESGSLVDETAYGVLDPLHVRSAYPESKRLAEAMIVACHAERGNPFRIFRLAHAYGPGMKLNDGRVLSDILGDMIAGRKIHLKSVGLHKIAVTYISDVISGVLHGILHCENGCYNLSNSDETYAIREIAKAAAEICSDGDVVFDTSADLKGLYLQHDTGILSSSKIQSTGFRFEISMAQGLLQMKNIYNSI